MNFNPTEIAAANATSRSAGAVGGKAITPRYVQTIAKQTDSILDYGAGKDAVHARRLRSGGLNVTAHEFGANRNENHDILAMTRQYDIVYASNVLNVQKSRSMLWDTLNQIRNSAKDGGRVVFNYPESPRLAEISTEFMETTAVEIFQSEPKRVGGTKKAPLWEIVK